MTGLVIQMLAAWLQSVTNRTQLLTGEAEKWGALNKKPQLFRPVARPTVAELVAELAKKLRSPCPQSCRSLETLMLLLRDFSSGERVIYITHEFLCWNRVRKIG